MHGINLAEVLIRLLSYYVPVSFISIIVILQIYSIIIRYLSYILLGRALFFLNRDFVDDLSIK